MAQNASLLQFEAVEDKSRASIRVLAGEPAGRPISRFLTGKFCEHLGRNIYNGMEAQVLRNPTFGDFPFGSRRRHPDGGSLLECDEERIAEQIVRQAERLGWPQTEQLVQSRKDGLAHWWIREPEPASATVSPDVAPNGDRAQRVEAHEAGAGLAQWTHLPLHRAREYQWRMIARSPDLDCLSLRLFAGQEAAPCAEAEIAGITPAWGTFTGTLDLPAGAPADSIYRLALVAPKAGQFVVARLLLYPADHVGGADPDVVRFLKDSHLPLLRWPGGNFVSGYHWEDGVGPIDARPTRPNMAWGCLEPNLFGTDEFIAFCREVGCEPMICVNAGNAGPEEAARWVEYCNGSADSPQGARRAANGHPEPYGVRLWEIGNEIYGRWQEGWTTPGGYADRYRQFVEAMEAADPSIEILACGAPLSDDPTHMEWNERLFRENASAISTTTHHLLVGGRVSQDMDPLDVYRDFMAVPVVYQDKYERLRETMLEAGVREPRLAVTELQLFAHLPHSAEQGARLCGENLVQPATLAEALYDTLVYHVAVRLGDLVEIVTHSATVNHGGGLRKDRERVYANPCHHAQTLFARLAGASAVPVELRCAEPTAPGVLDCTPAGTRAPVLDALAALAENGDLLISLVHRGTGPACTVAVEIDGFAPAGHAELWRLTAEAPWAANSLDAPDAVRPAKEDLPCEGGRICLELQPYTLVHLRVPGAASGVI